MEIDESNKLENTMDKGRLSKNYCLDLFNSQIDLFNSPIKKYYLDVFTVYYSPVDLFNSPIKHVSCKILMIIMVVDYKSLEYLRVFTYLHWSLVRYSI